MTVWKGIIEKANIHVCFIPKWACKVLVAGKLLSVGILLKYGDSWEDIISKSMRTTNSDYIKLNQIETTVL